MKLKATYPIIILILTCAVSKGQTTLEQEWVREYTGDFEMQDARDIAVDDNGNVFVGITSFDTISSNGFTLIKYDKDGDVQWTQKYEGTYEPGKSKSKDYVQDITLDHENNIYVVGRSEFLQAEPYDVHTTFITIKYNSKGEQQWLAEFRIDSLGSGWPYTILVDSSSNVYVGGNFEKSILIKYDSIGNLLWQKTVESVYSVNSMILDEYANIYITKPELSVIKYDSSGNYEWETFSDSLEGIATHYGYVTIDKQNNLYVNGAHSTVYNNNKIIVTVKYDRNGTFQWVRKYGQEAHYLRFVTAGCGVDDQGNIYVSGDFYNENNRDSRFMVIKYDSTGNQLWITEFDAPANSWLNLRKMAMDTAHNIYLIGSINTFNVDNYNLAIVKFDSSGTLLYSDFYGVPDRNEQATAIDIDGQQNIFIIGDSYSSKGQKVLTLKYIQKPVSIKPSENLLPISPDLCQNYPNPFNSTTTIFYSLPKTMRIDIKIYDLLGQEIKTLVSGQKRAGKHQIIFNANNLASGIYIYCLKSEKFTLSHKLLLIK